MVRLCGKSGRNIHFANIFLTGLFIKDLLIILKDESIKSLPSNASLKNNSSDSGDLNTAVRPRAIDNSCLVATSTLKVTF